MVAMSDIPARLEPLLAPDSPAQRVAAALTVPGYQCYLVGGSVRDALVGQQRTRRRRTTCDGCPTRSDRGAPASDRPRRRARRRPLRDGQRDVDGVPCEVTTFRSDVYHPESRKPEVVFGDDIETDLSRRDFSVNAMALRLPDPLLVDPFNGAVDLAERRLRTPISPDVSFTDDPLRMLRAARFIAGFGLEPVPELVAAVGEHRGRLEIVSAERIRDELSKLLVVDDPRPVCGSSRAPRSPDEFLPELNAMQLEQDPIHHHKDVLAHTIAVVQKVSPDLVLRLAALLHDIGKPKTRSFEHGRASFHHHEVVGAHGARAAHRAAVPEGRHRVGHPARVPAPAHPHVRDGLDRQRGAPLRARRRPAARAAQRAPAMRLHDPQRAQGPHWSAGWTTSKPASRRSPPKRS